MASKGKQLSELLDANGDVLQVNLDNVVVNATSVSDTDNTSTGQFTLPKGTTAQRPVTSYTGAQRYNTDLGAVEYYDGTGWFKVSSIIPIISSITGEVNDGYETTLTVSGSGFQGGNAGTFNFNQSSSGVDVDVSVTPSSDTSFTVTVPSSVYSNVTSGQTILLTYTNFDGIESGAVSKTVVAAPTGGTITTYGSYRVHTFGAGSSTFTTSQNLTVDYLLVAGGGSGGSGNGGSGGGGAGGMVTATSQSVSAGSYSIVVGAGGSGIGNVSDTVGNDGGNTTAFGNTIYGGGGGGAWSNKAGRSGGSGGGGGGLSASGGSGTSGQGNSGGSGNGSTSPYSGGGGGGKGTAGQTTGNGDVANGGSGSTNNFQTGSNQTYAGGGGAGTESPDGSQGFSLSVEGLGGSGGGGRGGYRDTVGQNGTNGLGGGGGGGGYPSGGFSSGSGGDGVVVIRYAI